MTPIRMQRVFQCYAAFRLRGVQGNLRTWDEREAGQHPLPPRGVLSLGRIALDLPCRVDVEAPDLPLWPTTARTRRTARRTSVTLTARMMRKNQIAPMTLVIPCEIPQIAPVVSALLRLVLESSPEPFVQLLGGH